MSQLLNIKGKKIGEGRPLVCVPIMVSDSKQIIKEAATLGELYQYETYRWYGALKKTATKLQIAFDQDAIKSMNAFQITQKFLDAPVIKALDTICSGDGGEFDD